MNDLECKDIVIGPFCSVHDEHKGWAFPGMIYERSHIRARTLAAIYARKMRLSEHKKIEAEPEPEQGTLVLA